MIRTIKPIVYTLSLFGGICLALVSCKEDRIIFEGPFHVRFTDTTVIQRESYPRTLNLQVHNAGPQLKEAITVQYVVSGTAREGIDYTILGTKGEVVIPANQSFGEIQVKLINNANDRLDTQNLIFTLTSVKPASLQVGFGKNKNIGNKMTLTIQDDCILSGYYIGTRVLSGSTVTVPNIQVTSTDCNEFLLSNWNVEIFTVSAVHPTLKVIDVKDNSIIIPPQLNTYFGSDTLRGTGSWNPLNGNLTLNIEWKTKTRNQKDDSLVRLPTLVFIPEK